jgi:hypothetical protein
MKRRVVLFAAQDYGTRRVAMWIPVEYISRNEFRVLKYRGEICVIRIIKQGLGLLFEPLPILFHEAFTKVCALYGRTDIETVHAFWSESNEHFWRRVCAMNTNHIVIDRVFIQTVRSAML